MAEEHGIECKVYSGRSMSPANSGGPPATNRAIVCILGQLCAGAPCRGEESVHVVSRASEESLVLPKA